MLGKLREPVKHLLRMCGHAFCGTVHTRLDKLQQQIDDLNLRLTSVAESQEALLRASIYLVEELRARGAAQGAPENPPPRAAAGPPGGGAA
jgi:hypothetical protein